MAPLHVMKGPLNATSAPISNGLGLLDIKLLALKGMPAYSEYVQKCFSQKLQNNIGAALQCQDVAVIVERDWGSLQPESRRKIRLGIVEHLKKNNLPLSPDDELALLNLKAVPKIKGLALSISHCQSLGGYALSQTARSLGFDIEDKIAIKKRVVERVAGLDEIQRAPDYQMLWSAKEAVWKSLIRQPSPLPSIKIASWQLHGSEVFTFTAEWSDSAIAGFIPGRGCVLGDDERWYGFFIPI